MLKSPDQTVVQCFSDFNHGKCGTIALKNVISTIGTEDCIRDEAWLVEVTVVVVHQTCMTGGFDPLALVERRTH